MKASAGLFLLLALCALPPAQAHHGAVGAGALYDTAEMIIIDGEITDLFWANPHVRFKVTGTDKAGQPGTWVIESGVPSQMEGGGITREMFYVGQHVKIAGYAARWADNLVGLRNILFENGQEHVYGRGDPLLFSDQRVERAATARTPVSDEERARAEAEARASARSIFRVWSSPEDMTALSERLDFDYLLTDVGRETLAAYDAIQHPLITECKARGMPERMLAATLDIVDEGDAIRIRQLWWGGDRIIHLDAEQPPADAPKSHLGYSVGRWEDENTLYVKTTHVNWPYFDKEGFPQSDQVWFEERFTLNEPEERLEYELISHDPVMYTEPLVDHSFWNWRPTGSVNTGSCELWRDGGAETGSG